MGLHVYMLSSNWETLENLKLNGQMELFVIVPSGNMWSQLNQHQLQAFEELAFGVSKNVMTWCNSSRIDIENQRWAQQTRGNSQGNPLSR